jgi:hypothetical protein
VHRSAILLTAAVLFLAGGDRAGGQDHGLFTSVLADHVRDGRVRYAALREDPRFTAYIELLSASAPDLLRSNEATAFWINAYNAFTLKVVADNYPVESITDLSTGPMAIAYVFKTSVWDREFVPIGGKVYSLNMIEHDILRPRGDARIHFALVCAARSCPPLRAEAYNAVRLDEQLDDQGRIFIRDTRHNRVDLDRGEVTLSRIFDWYAGDFESEAGSVLRYVARYLPDSLGRQILEREGDLTITHMEYDWRLND